MLVGNNTADKSPPSTRPSQIKVIGALSANVSPQVSRKNSKLSELKNKHETQMTLASATQNSVSDV